MKLFSTLTRDDCVALARIDKSVVQAAYRVEQLKLLRDLLDKRGSSYYEEATWEFFQSLAPYEETQYHSYQGEMPECVLKSFKIMFDAFDEFITDMIGDHYELQGWDDPLGEVVWCEDLFYEQEAWDAYNECVADGDKYVFLRKVDKEGMPIEDIACNF